MRKIILKMQSSLDGVVSDVGQWMTMNDEILEEELEFYDTLDTFIVGGKTYPGLSAYWQEAEKSSDSDLERRYAKRINEMENLFFRVPTLIWFGKTLDNCLLKMGSHLAAKLKNSKMEKVKILLS